MKLIIVESPTKANTFNKFLKKGEYHVEATLGHVRDLPEGSMSLDLKKDFAPTYEMVKKRFDVITRIRSYAKKAESIILATDSDREGEAISYHIAYLLGYIKETWPISTIKKAKKLQRIVFHEITKEALEEALHHPRSLNIDLVDAQQARRILDRIVGYRLSPLLWKKMGKRWLSAGRVQTSALRFIVEREKEINKFKKEAFFKVFALFHTNKNKKTLGEFKAELIAYHDARYQKSFTIALFDGEYTYSQTTIQNTNVDNIVKDINSDVFEVSDVVVRSVNRFPSPPFTTSSLQQEASRIFGFSARVTMQLAQGLYEKGVITYHRTDSVTMSEKFLEKAQQFIRKKYGEEYSLSTHRLFKTKSKLAQEAHEAIRPTDLYLKMAKHNEFNARQKKLYDLIFKKAIASQMKEALIETNKIKIISGKGYLFETQWERILFPGFLILYPQNKKKNEEAYRKIKLAVGDQVFLKFCDQKPLDTAPPPRYNEASLIKTLEEKGIGRPSTYAPIISTMQDRNYTEKRDNRFYPTFLGTAVCDYLSSAFEEIFKIDFTAHLEEDLDAIAEKKKDMIVTLHSFYDPFSILLDKQHKAEGHINVEQKTDEKCPKCGHYLVFRYSKFGKFYGCSTYPKCTFAKGYKEAISTPCPKCGSKIVIKVTGKKRKFYGCINYPKCTFAAWKLYQIQNK